MIFIKDIDFRKPLFSTYSYKKNQDTFISNTITEQIFNNINIFIGENNSGKSRLMRSLFANHPYELGLLTEQAREKFEISGIVNMLYTTISNFVIFLDVTRDKRATYSSYLNLDSILSQLSGYTSYEKINSIYDIFCIIGVLRKLQLTIRNQLNTPLLHPDAYKYSDKALQDIYKAMEDIERDHKKLTINARYIPIFRGLKPLIQRDTDSWEYKNVLQDRVFYEYFHSFGKDTLKSMIFTGQNFFNLVKSKLLGLKNGREFITNYEKYLSENFFDDKEVSIYPNEEKEIVLIKIGDDEERPIYDLGDGIQSIIILTFEMFSNANMNMIFFIEEPETYLHPKYQRRLIETFKKPEFESFQFFITTHSNHLLDLSFDYSGISIFTFYPSDNNLNKKFIVEKVSSDDIKPYEILGVRNSSLLLSNCTIWVEGITDRMYINKYLELYQNHYFNRLKYREDIHYSFIEYSGNNITHWSFLDDSDQSINYKAITKKIFVIADSDSPNTGHAKLKRQEILKEKLKSNFYLLHTREVENLVSLDVLKKVISKFEKRDTSEQLLNLKIKTQDSYRKIKMGEFLDKNVVNKGRKYAASSGTIRDKLDFCKYSIDSMESYNDLSDDAKDLVENLIKFIEENNKR